MSKKIIAVHDGLFHADECVAVALWLLSHPGEVYTVIRTRDVEALAAADVVMDVGSEYNPETLRFDHHHQTECPVHQGTDGIKYAATGLVWDFVKDGISHIYFGGLNVVPFYEFQDRITNQLILGIDAQDNGQTVRGEGVHQFTLGELVKTMNCSNVRSAEQEIVFNQLIEVVKAWLDKYLKNTAQAVKDKYTVLDAAGKAEDGILVLPGFSPVWKEVCLTEGLPIKVCLVDAGRGEWSITSALKESGSMAPLCPAPAELRGAQAADNKTLGGCPVVFVHKAGFTGKVKADNLDQALTAARAWVNGTI